MKRIVILIMLLCGIVFANSTSIVFERGRYGGVAMKPWESVSNSIAISATDSIQVAVNSKTGTAASPATIFLLPGTYSITTAISVPSYTRLEGLGDGVIIKQGSAANITLLTNSDPSGGNTNIELCNITFDGNLANNTTQTVDGVNFTKTNYVRVENCTFQNCWTDGIELNQCSYFDLRDLRFSDCRWKGINLTTSQYGEVSGVLMIGTFYGHHMTDCHDIIISNMEITAHRNEGFVSLRSSIYPYAINVTNLAVHNAFSIDVSGASYTDTDKRITKAAGDFSTLRVRDLIYVYETADGQITDAEYTVASVAADGSYITINDPGSDSAGDVGIYVSAGGSHIIDNNRLQITNSRFDYNSYDGLKVSATGASGGQKNAFFNVSANNNTNASTHALAVCSGTSLQALTDFSMTGCVASANESYNAYINSCTNGVVSGCIFNSSVAADGIYLITNTNVAMSGCVTNSNGVYGIRVGTTGTSVTNNVSITGCVSRLNYSGIYTGTVTHGTLCDVQVRNCIFTGNTNSEFSDATVYALPNLRRNNIVGTTAVTTTLTLTAAHIGQIITNTGDADGAAITLPAAVPGMGPFYVRLTAAQTLSIDPDGAETTALAVGGAQQAAGKNISANAIDEFIILNCYTAGTWNVEDVAGTWTAEL